MEVPRDPSRGLAAYATTRRIEVHELAGAVAEEAQSRPLRLLAPIDLGQPGRCEQQRRCATARHIERRTRQLRSAATRRRGTHRRGIAPPPTWQPLDALGRQCAVVALSTTLQETHQEIIATEAGVIHRTALEPVGDQRVGACLQQQLKYRCALRRGRLLYGADQGRGAIGIGAAVEVGPQQEVSHRIEVTLANREIERHVGAQHVVVAPEQPVGLGEVVGRERGLEILQAVDRPERLEWGESSARDTRHRKEDGDEQAKESPRELRAAHLPRKPGSAPRGASGQDRFSSLSAFGRPDHPEGSPTAGRR